MPRHFVPRLGWTQKQIVEVLGISQGRVAQIINNANFCEINNLLTQGRDMECIQTNPHIFLENELQDDSVCAIFAPTAEDFSVVQIEGKRMFP